MENCLFCKIRDGEIPSSKVFENDVVLAFLDLNPVNPGHVLLIPKKHSETLSEASPDDASELMRVVPMLMNSIMKATGASACNIGVNNGKLAGQVVFHTHLHIMPRFENDGYDIWHGKPYESEDRMKEVAEKIRGQIPA